MVRDALTVAKEGTLKVKMSLKVASLTQIRLGNSTSSDTPLAAMLRESVMLAIWVLKEVRRLLLLISNVPILIKLRPNRVVKKVLVMVQLVHSEMKAGSVSDDRAGRADQRMVVTLVNWENWTVDSKVRF